MIKSVQIRSFVKGGNHGQYLQALGLAELVKRLLPDAEVTHLDYENHFAKELKIQTFSGMLPKFLVMRYFWNKNLKFSAKCAKSDLSIYGSDMIWHLDSDLFPPDPKLFGEGDFAAFKIAYAPSAGYRVENEPNWIDGLLNSFSAIGVRDENTLNLVKEHSELTPNLVIDPCFHLLNSKYAFWFTGKERGEFISVYSPLSHRFVEAFHKNLDFEALPSWIQCYKYLGYFPRKRFFQDSLRQFTDPMWTVQQIARSKLLITSTFHGVMMALMTKTPFIVVTSPNLSARLQSPIAETFSAKRLMTMDEFTNLSDDGLKPFLASDDINHIKLKEYISSSEEWLEARIVSLAESF